MANAEIPREVDRLAFDFPGWTIWRSGRGNGWWWATREGRLTNREIYAGLCQTLAGDDAPKLRAQLDGQREAEARLSWGAAGR